MNCCASTVFPIEMETNLAISAKERETEVVAAKEFEIRRQIIAAKLPSEKIALETQLDELNQTRKEIEQKFQADEIQIKLDGDRKYHQEYLAMEDEWNAARLDHEAEIQRGLDASEAKHQDSLAGDMEGIGLDSQHMAAAGLANALVDIASGAKSAKEALRQMAASFLQDISRMILQATLFRIIQSGVSALGGGGGWNFGDALANGGQRPRLAANGFNGTVSSPTYLPNFNVIAGEAGLETLTVMARPRMMNIGGRAAQVGDVAGRTMALTDVSDGGGAGGRMVIEVRVSSGSEARIVEQSIAGAVAQVIQQIPQQGAMSGAIKSLVS